MNPTPLHKSIIEQVKSVEWKKAGIAGLIFFCLKGLVWLAAPLTLYCTR
ncbi:MAG TPA: hypothetical protein PK878_09115 [bacterium]|nr:hypothetical protein [bacterium]